ncbi:MAG TPA: phosphoribosylanthranilate isomerase, partial [Solirubrobacteraceae bacterium]|nr:phosphoribosylanthranilate isomerase [Solirubrobacteraceae bacterium]
TFDWSLVRARRSKVPLILSGGLNADNVVAAIEATHPFAVDTASGTEATPGHKDPQRLRAFFEAVAGTAEHDAVATEEPMTATAEDVATIAGGGA